MLTQIPTDVLRVVTTYFAVHEQQYVFRALCTSSRVIVPRRTFECPATISRNGQFRTKCGAHGDTFVQTKRGRWKHVQGDNRARGIYVVTSRAIVWHASHRMRVITPICSVWDRRLRDPVRRRKPKNRNNEEGGSRYDLLAPSLAYPVHVFHVHQEKLIDGTQTRGELGVPLPSIHIGLSACGAGGCSPEKNIRHSRKRTEPTTTTKTVLHFRCRGKQQPRN